MYYITLILISTLVIVLAGLLAAARRWRGLARREARVLLTGGGTGGHVNPALAIAEGIRRKEPDTRFLYVGVRGKAEAVIVRRAGYPLKFVCSEGFPGLKPSPATFRFLCKLSIGIAQSVFILFRFAPRWIIATGGYVSAPIILATLILRALHLAPTKVFLHEQNSIPGQLNSWLGRWADRVLLTFPQTLVFFPKNGVVVGYPIRYSVISKPREEALPLLPCRIPDGRRTVFVFGGSQGARTINRAIVDSLRYLLPYREKLFIIHGMGLNKSAEYDAEADTEARLLAQFSEEERALLGDFYYRQDYFHNIADVYSVSDLIVCRSGAGSLNEISGLGKPSLLIPKANLPGDHQVMNARAMKHAGATEILFEDTVVEASEVLEKVEGEVLADRILRLLNDSSRLQEMGIRSRQFLRRHSNERILSELYGDHSYNNGTGFHSIPFSPLVSNFRLLSILSTAYNESPQHFDPMQIIGDEDDLAYYHHRAAGLLSHEAWQDRNLGVKLIGLTRYQE
ncbi:MAG: UDP-N-acetylglucosamine--N-acetylmuramyl-(pentapeptide) pyrophosphoryl-undecaprenol N-acetylglucosamine transferase, partial [Desulforhabdus sp.]|nr:UDP-N-acetylglucosamine--N-acetylmuramyl-(pentapeptide) pyrophosphoryl-undecaprenol N-acetylglucosamine transferase [Desulforhabdus sp.]